MATHHNPASRTARRADRAPAAVRHLHQPTSGQAGPGRNWDTST